METFFFFRFVLKFRFFYSHFPIPSNDLLTFNIIIMSSEPVSTLNGFTLPSHELLINQVNQLTKTVGSMKETIKSLRSTVDQQQKEISELKKQIETILKLPGVYCQSSPELNRLYLTVFLF